MPNGWWVVQGCGWVWIAVNQDPNWGRILGVMMGRRLSLAVVAALLALVAIGTREGIAGWHHHELPREGRNAERGVEGLAEGARKTGKAGHRGQASHRGHRGHGGHGGCRHHHHDAAVEGGADVRRGEGEQPGEPIHEESHGHPHEHPHEHPHDHHHPGDCPLCEAVARNIAAPPEAPAAVFMGEVMVAAARVGDERCAELRSLPRLRARGPPG
jgi:hypothetical protein